MKRVLLFLTLLLIAGLSFKCGSSSELAGLAINKVQLEGELAAAGATLNQSGQPDLIGKEDSLTPSARYEVAKGAQPQNVAHYRRAIVERVVTKLAAQNRSPE